MAAGNEEKSGDIEGRATSAQSLLESVKSMAKSTRFRFFSAAWIFLVATVAGSLCLLCIIRIKLIPDASKFESSGLVYIPAILVPWLGFTAGVMASISSKLIIDANPSRQIRIGKVLYLILGWGFCAAAGLAFVIFNPGVITTAFGAIAFGFCCVFFLAGHCCLTIVTGL
jgi:hypothetical protein